MRGMKMEESGMQCAIYALSEMKKKLLLKKKNLLVLCRYEGKIILQWDEARAVWTLPGGQRGKVETQDAAARRIATEALGESALDVQLLCGFGVPGEDGKELCGFAYVADVTSWQGEWGGKTRAFESLPVDTQLADAQLVHSLRKWAGDFFDARLDLERLGDVESR